MPKDCGSSEDSVDEEDSTSDSDCSYQSFSPITSEEEFSSDNFSDASSLTTSSDEDENDGENETILPQSELSGETSHLFQASERSSQGKLRSILMC